ncbi:MAG: hypothetical protein R3281_02170, partial [Balneolaceae bacterium]|nr:hypothetical protein [Balneolaceae bacterium]
MIDLKVNQQRPGSVITVAQGEELAISVSAFVHERQVPLQSLELIMHGEVVERRVAGSREKITLRTTKNAEKGVWIAA